MADAAATAAACDQATLLLAASVDRPVAAASSIWAVVRADPPNKDGLDEWTGIGDGLDRGSVSKCAGDQMDVFRF